MKVRRQLAQIRPNVTTGVTGFTLTSSTPFTIDLVNVVNVGTSQCEVSIFHDVDGTTFDETTALVWRHILRPSEILCYEEYISGFSSAENVGVQCSVADSANFTIYGTIPKERL
jgi:hypothetical protein